MRSRSLAVILAALVFAGCLGSNDGDVPTTTLQSGETSVDAPLVPDATGASPSPFVVPIWNVGDAWAGTTFNGDETVPFTLVVTAVDGQFYTIETTDEQTAGWDAMYDVSYVGKIRASDLAGSQQDTPVTFFSFPLEDGKTWTATWDASEVALTAKKTARGFDITGTVEGEPYVAFDFDPELRWWSKLDFVRDGYGITIDRLVPGWTGSLASATAKLVYEGHPAAPIASPGSGAFTIDEGQTFATVSIQGGGSQWVRLLYLVQPDGTPYMAQTNYNYESELMGPRDVYVDEQIPATPGEWHIVAPGVHDPAGAFHVTVHQVAVATKQFP